MPLVRRVIPAPGGEGTSSHTVPPIPAVGCHRMAALTPLCLMALMAHALAMGTSACGALPDCWMVADSNLVNSQEICQVCPFVVVELCLLC